MLPFSYETRVRYNECDPQGVVFNANYLVYMDLTMTELWRHILGGAGYPDLTAKHGVDVVVAEANVKYLAPARFDDNLTITVEEITFGNTSMNSTLVVKRGDERIGEGKIRNVFISPDTWKPVPAPDAVKALLSS